MLFEISYINKQGDIESLTRTICGQEFESMIHAMRFRTKKTFIYDATSKDDANVELQHFTFSQNVAFSQESNFNMMETVINRQYGKSANIDVPFMSLDNSSNDRLYDNDAYFSL